MLFRFPGSHFKNRSRSDSRLRGNDGSHLSMLRALLFGLLLVISTGSSAQVSDPTPLQFTDAAEEARFHDLASHLRCVMCQNQSLADSNAQVAQDLRREVLHLIQQGKSDAEIKRFLVERYGEFVLYKPELQPGTWLLWFGPALLLLGGGLVVFRIVRKRSRTDVALPPEDQEW